MNDFLRKIKLLEHITIELDSSKIDFIKTFRGNVDQSNLGVSDHFFEALTSSKNEYKGNIDNHLFKLRRRRRFLDTNRNFAVAEGTMAEKDGKLILETEITGFHYLMKFFYAFIIVFYLIFIIGFSFTTVFEADSVSFFVFPFILVHALLMLGIPYFVMRRSVSRMKYELERDFHFWTK